MALCCGTAIIDAINEHLRKWLPLDSFRFYIHMKQLVLIHFHCCISLTAFLFLCSQSLMQRYRVLSKFPIFCALHDCMLSKNAISQKHTQKF